MWLAGGWVERAELLSLLRQSDACIGFNEKPAEL